MENLSNASTIVRILSVLEAVRLRCDRIGPEHLFLGLCRAAGLSLREMDEFALHLQITGTAVQRMKFEFEQLRSALVEAKLDPKRVYDEFSAHVGTGDETGEGKAMHRNEKCREIFRIAERLARDAGSFRILPVHLPWAIVVENTNIAYSFLYEHGCDVNLLSSVCQRKSKEPFLESQEKEEQKKAKSRTPLLDSFGCDLTARAAAGECTEVIGREEEIAAVCRGLIRKDRSAVVLLGEAGVGKTAVAEGLALAIAKNTLPEPLRSRFGNMRIIEISMGSLVAGTQYRGQFEERVQTMLTEARENRDSVILFVDEIHLMMGAGAGTQGGIDAANLLKPALSRREVNLIGATTESEYVRYIEKDAAMDRRFVKVYVNEPSRDETLAIMTGLRESLQRHYEVQIDDEALAAAVDFTMRYIPHMRLPAKALDALHQACANRLCAKADQAFWTDPTGSKPTQRRPHVTREDVAHVISGTIKIPASRLLATPETRMDEIREKLLAGIIGQNEAVNAVCDTILRAQMGLTDPDRPDGIFLLLGPTGVGKTELVKVVADALFEGNRDHFVQIDMSEYSERHEVSRLVGAAPGYVGYEEGGILTDAVRKQPYCVVLFDEVEKAHPDIFDIFLQIFEEGRLTDNHGRRADFRHAMIFMTSNLGAAVGTPRMGIGLEASDGKLAREQYRKRTFEEVKRRLRPELVNRIDKMVFFDPLQRADVRKIAEKIAAQWAQRIRSEHGVNLELTPAAYDFIAERGYSDLFGARELRRVIEQTVVGAVADRMDHEPPERGTTLIVDVENGNVVLRKRDQAQNDA